MTGEFDERPRARRWPWILLALLLAFAAGAAAMVYTVRHSSRVAGWLALAPVSRDGAAQVALAQPVATRPVVVVRPVAPPPVPAGPDPETLNRIADLQDKVAAIETQARAATGDASRAEGLLVAFAARRALDRGLQLGYIEGLVRQRFGRSQPEAVASLLSAARQPVTLADLQNLLDTTAPALAAGGSNAREGWWSAFRRELAGMVVVRQAGEPSTQPGDRVARAERMLEAGQVDAALAEILRLPDHKAASRWIEASRRYLTGRGALDRIETAALLDPGMATQIVTIPPPAAPRLPVPVAR